ncbi:MAG: MarR family transcriptional regulator [Rhizobiaceae bacterium]|nr:MarR family transcriptional regulator [Rhizobiaceae bacterium]
MVKSDTKKIKRKNANGQKRKTKKRSSNTAIINLLGDIHRGSRASLSEKLQKLGLFGGQERIILLLKDHDGLTPSEIAEKLNVSPPTIAKSISRLTARGVLVRRIDKSDRRRANVFLSNVGHSMVKSIEKEQRKWKKKVLKSMNKAEKAELLRHLRQILSNIDQID